MDIIISFTTTLGVIEAFKIKEVQSVAIINNSTVMSLKNEKYPKTGGGNINNRDNNRKYPSFPNIPGLIPLLSMTNESSSTSYKLDEYLSDRKSSIAGYFFWGYGAETESKVKIAGGVRIREGTISTTGELGSPNLNYSYFAPYGIYEGSGGSGSYYIEDAYSTGYSLVPLSKAEYVSSFEGKPSSGSSESSSEFSGTTSVLGKPYSSSHSSSSSFSGSVVFVKS